MKRLVITASCYTIFDDDRSKQEYDETCWNEPKKGMAAYEKSKVLAERAAWDFQKEHPELEIVTLHPGFIVGPMFIKCPFASQTYITKMMRGKLPVARVSVPIVDVRDVAIAHLKAVTCKPNERYALLLGMGSFQEMATILRDEFRPIGYKVKTKPIPGCVFKTVACINKDAKAMKPFWGRNYVV